MYQCIVCEDWLHHECLLGSHSDSNDSPLGSDDFDQVICDGCARTNGQVRKILERYAGKEGTGVMLVGGEGGKEVLGRAILDDDDQELAAEESAAASDVAMGSTSTSTEKRKAASPKLEDDSSVSDQPALKKHKTEGVHAPTSSTSSILPSTSSAISTSSTAPRPVPATSAPPAPPSSVPGDCKAPVPLAPGEISPLRKLESEGGKLNVYLEEGWMMRWCRCAEVSSTGSGSICDLVYLLSFARFSRLNMVQ
jgi:E3 ubiquitin-protein ligase UBR7